LAVITTYAADGLAAAPMAIRGPRGIIAGVTIRRRVWTLVAAFVLGLLGAPLVAAPASAHAELSSTSPARDEIVRNAPSQVVLTFTEGVTPVEGKVRVIAPDGSRADTGEPSVRGNNVIIPLRADGPRGTYLVTYRVISADSHPVAGAFTYSYFQTSAPPTDTGADTRISPWIISAFPVVRWVGYVGLLLAVGGILVLTLLWPRRLPQIGPRRVVLAGGVAVAVATIGELLLEVPYVAGGWRASDVQQVISSQFGAAHLVRLGVLVAAGFLLRPALRDEGGGAERVLLAVLGVIGVVTWSLSGHPGSSPAPVVSVAADMIHLGAMSVWVGGLVMLVGFLLPRANAAELGAIVPVWSRWATYAVAALLVTGVAQALIEVGAFGPLVTTTYGWLLLAKVGLILGVLGVAFFTRRLVGPIAARTDGAVRRLRLLVMAEAIGAALAIGVASVLVQTTPARTAASVAPVPPGVQTVTLSDPLFVLSVDLQPIVGGDQYELHMYASTPDAQPADVKEWQVKASLPSQGIEPIQADVLPYNAWHATGTIGLPAKGTWTFTFTLRLSEFDQSTVSAQFVIS
jgi:copper transport protein